MKKRKTANAAVQKKLRGWYASPLSMDGYTTTASAVPSSTLQLAAALTDGLTTLWRRDSFAETHRDYIVDQIVRIAEKHFEPDRKDGANE